MNRYFLIPKERAKAIQADSDAVFKSNLARLSEMVGAEVTACKTMGNLAFGYARITGVILKNPAAEHNPLWVLAKGETDVLAPNRRFKAGRAASEEMEGMDALQLLSAMKRAGVSPWARRQKKDPFRIASGHVGIEYADGAMLLESQDDWEHDWPDWVQEIKGSEYHALLEAAGTPV